MRFSLDIRATINHVPLGSLKITARNMVLRENILVGTFFPKVISRRT
jgi:hypothetical protein